MAKVKICGLTNYNDALDATNLGVDFLGFHFIKESPKKVSEKLFNEVASKLPPFVIPVGVFANEDLKGISKVVKKCSLTSIQLNGDESPEFCSEIKEKLGIKIFKLFKLENEEDILKLEPYSKCIDYFLFDISYTDGENIKYNYELASNAGRFNIPFFISGSIGPENVQEALEEAAPFGIDGDTGIERLPRRKDYEKMNTFIRYSHGLK